MIVKMSSREIKRYLRPTNGRVKMERFALKFCAIVLLMIEILGTDKAIAERRERPFGVQR